MLFRSAGLALLQAGRAEGADARFVAAYRRPSPPIEAGVLAAGSATAMIDVSDGLVRDACRLARASGVVIDLDGPLADVALLAPIAERLGAAPLEWVLGGGEDHGLLATFPAGAPVPEPFTVIGSVRPAGGGTAAGSVLVAGEVPTGITGWDHFAG